MSRNPRSTGVRQIQNEERSRDPRDSEETKRPPKLRTNSEGGLTAGRNLEFHQGLPRG